MYVTFRTELPDRDFQSVYVALHKLYLITGPQLSKVCVNSVASHKEWGGSFAVTYANKKKKN